MPVFVDAEQIARTWTNSRSDTLVGVGNPLEKGAFLNPPHGDYTAYAEIQLTGGSPALSAENPDQRASLSWLVYGRTRQAASDAAVALANELEDLDGRDGPGGSLLVADNVTAPLYTPDGPVARYLVSADLFLRAV
ncbi:hypothetical protein AB0F72_09035 [Actinoplanes sp. NPDC023936]|uniref:hypothetical protein n=1 Tax=Actinoplanes sp. NPDC023936 TaxID=3154910 RepID=UPI0033F65EF3